MKKKLLLLLALAVVIVGVNSCSTDPDYPENDPSGDSGNWRESVTRAKAYFEAVYSPDLKSRTAQHSPAVAALSSMEVNPDWEHSLYSEDEHASYLEFPLLSHYRYESRLGHRDNPDEPRVDQRRLVIRQDTETGEMEMYTSVWLPDDEASEEMMPGLTLCEPVGFFGQIYYFYPDGEFRRGVLLRDGEVTGTVTVSEKSDEPPTDLLTRGAGGSCTIYYGGNDYYWCYSVADGSGCVYLGSDIEWAYEICYEVGGQGGHAEEGGGGDGGGSAGPGNPYPTYLKLALKDQKTAESIQPLLQKINNDCLGQVLISYLGDRGVSIEYDSSLTSPAVTGTATGNIRWKESGAVDYIIFEELFHAYQVKSGGMNTQYKASMEIEAKVAVWHYMQRTNQGFQGDKRAWEMIGRFALNPTAENYGEAITAVALMGYTEPDYKANSSLYTLPNYNRINPCNN